MAKLTRQELRIIEQTKQQAPADNEQKKPGKWASVRAMLLFTAVFVLFVFCAYLIIGFVTR